MFALTPRDEFQRLSKYRTDLFAEIKRAMEIYGHWKSYEGEIAVRMPGANASPLSDWVLVVLCYVASDDETGSRYEYRGKTLAECLEQAERDLAAWRQETDEYLTKRQEQCSE